MFEKKKMETGNCARRRRARTHAVSRPRVPAAAPATPPPTRFQFLLAIMPFMQAHPVQIWGYQVDAANQAPQRHQPQANVAPSKRASAGMIMQSPVSLAPRVELIC